MQNYLKAVGAFFAKAAPIVVDIEIAAGPGNGDDKRKQAIDRLLADTGLPISDWFKPFLEGAALMAINAAVAYFNAQGIFPK